MSDTPHNSGPPMIAATKILDPGPARIGQITQNFSLPRTVEIRQVVAAFAGALVLLIPAIFLGTGLMSWVMAIGLGGGAGVLVVTYRPGGESVATKLGLQAASVARRNGAVTIDGKPATAYVGIAPLPRLAEGPVQLVPGAVDVPLGSVDDRGVPVLDHAEGLLDRVGRREHRHVTGPVRSAPAGALPTPTRLPTPTTRPDPAGPPATSASNHAASAELFAPPPTAGPAPSSPVAAPGPVTPAAVPTTPGPVPPTPATPPVPPGQPGAPGEASGPVPWPTGGLQPRHRPGPTLDGEEAR